MTNVRYKDLDLDFLPNVKTGDVSVKINEEAIKRSLRNLIQLTRSDKPFHPEISCGVRELLFEQASIMTAIRMEQEIQRVINSYEPRVIVNSITVRPDDTQNGYDITINFSIVNSAESSKLNVSLKRLR